MNKIILFYPDCDPTTQNKYYWLPYSILAVGSALTAANYEVILVDENSRQLGDDLEKKILLILKENENDIVFVGISSFIGYQIRRGLEFAKIVRSFDKNIPIVWGGWHPTILTDSTIENEYADFIIKGQGEYTITELADTLKNKNKSFSDIKGLVYKEDGIVCNNPDRSSVQRSKLPRYDWSLVNINDYAINDPAINTKTISYISSQGCPHNCGFCSDAAVYKRKWYALTSEQMFEDINYILSNFNVNGISFYDSNFTVDPQRIFDFCKLIINSKLKFKWAAASDLYYLKKLSNEQWELMREAGCVRLLVGAESGSSEIIKLIDKKFSPDDIVEIAKKSISYGISIYFTLVVGWPPKPENDFEKTRELISRVRNETMEHEFIVHIYAPIPGTPLYEYARQNGYLPPEDLDGWANYDYYNITTPWVTQDFLEKVRKYRIELNISYKVHMLKKNTKQSSVLKSS